MSKNRMTCREVDAPSGSAPANEKTISFSHPCLFFDLEAGKRNNQIRAFAAIRSDTSDSICFPDCSPDRNLKTALKKLDEFARGTSFLVGHNLIKFDLLYLKAINPGLGLLRLPSIDTLWLSPLAFPKNPYHRDW